MSKKLKLYLVSILGVSRTYKDDQPKSLYVHLPIMVEAKDIDTAADQACTEAEKWFPQHEGFVDCDISITPLSSEYYLRLSQFTNLKRLAEAPDTRYKPITSRCHTGGDNDEEEDVVVEFDRPAS